MSVSSARGAWEPKAEFPPQPRSAAHAVTSLSLGFHASEVGSLVSDFLSSFKNFMEIIVTFFSAVLEFHAGSSPSESRSLEIKESKGFGSVGLIPGSKEERTKAQISGRA